MTATIIDTPAAMAKLLSSLAWLEDNPPSLYLDIEGTDLSRSGTIAIIQLYVAPLDAVYLIDIVTLGDVAFSTRSADNIGHTFKEILESTAFVKVFFDVRSDSDALFNLYGVRLARVHDLQLMELAVRGGSRNWLNGLAKCIEYDGSMTIPEKEKWSAAKQRGRCRFNPGLGGSYAVFSERPLADDILEYCVQDVRFLPGLWKVYHKLMSAEWAERMIAETKRRIWASQQEIYHGKGPHMRWGPLKWSEEYS